MFFEDKWIVIDIADAVVRNGEAFAVSWNGEACAYQLMSRGRQWPLNSANPEFGPANINSGQCGLIGRAVIQSTRILTNRL
ncbi:S24 family peptidase [Massilia sp.]|uniref:S24 family peptidase n=1 Tax=Massilia sp. TaxID=1882437 RepID=UPI00352F2005